VARFWRRGTVLSAARQTAPIGVPILAIKHRPTWCLSGETYRMSSEEALTSCRAGRWSVEGGAPLVVSVICAVEQAPLARCSASKAWPCNGKPLTSMCHFEIGHRWPICRWTILRDGG